MKYIIISLFALGMFSCSHNIPIANLEFEKIVKNDKNKNSYFLYFSSDVELLKNLHINHNGARVECFFKGDNVEEKDFIDNHSYTLTSVNGIKTIPNPKFSEQLYYYYVKVRFVKSDNNGSSDFLDEKNIPEISTLLSKKPNCLSCVITAVTYMNTTKRYISNTMCLPKDELKKVVEK